MKIAIHLFQHKTVDGDDDHLVFLIEKEKES